MSSGVKAPGIDRLTVADRMLLVEEIWDSIVDEADSQEIPQSRRDEPNRRLAADQADPRAGSTWDEGNSRLMGRPQDRQDHPPRSRSR